MSASVNSVQSVGVSCVYCGEGHLYEDCPSNPASTCYVGVSSSGANVYHRPSHPPGFPSQQPITQAMEASSSLENLIKEYIAKNDARVQSHDATLRSLENQIGQIANALNVRPQGSLPMAAEFEKNRSPKMINEDDLAVSDEYEEASDNQVSWMESRHTAVRGGKHFESLELSERAFKSYKPSVDEPPVLELKPVPTHLRDSGSRKKKRKNNWIHRTSAALWSLPAHRFQRLSPKTPRCQLPSSRTLAPSHCFAPQRRHTDSPHCQLPTLNQQRAPT
ncbi:hypothetical protein TIFTF001_049169 [Ficus carica]|uniref:Uncharacterized protein n=1 Tax=Ficus carica TaxID=3494 RepID=A0AA87Z5K7_FICCA|nr:hypothetical protein TIFTF001_049169 [Ficus carica]